jgi:hypothetical protein
LSLEEEILQIQSAARIKDFPAPQNVYSVAVPSVDKGMGNLCIQIDYNKFYAEPQADIP